MPGDSGLRLAANDAAMSFALLGRGGNGGGLFPEAWRVGSSKLKPVIVEHMRLTVRERHNMVRDIRAGRECQVRTIVAIARIMRLVVKM